MYVSPRSHDDYMRAYERALLRALGGDRREGAGGRSEHPVGHLPGSAGVRDLLRQPRPADYKERVFALLARLGAAVPLGVELGYHLCYGSPADQHLVMPRDTAILTEIGNGDLRARRPGRGLPAPAGAARARRRRLLRRRFASCAVPATTRLYLGLIHWDDAAGDRRRIDAARTLIPDFGIASECGWGRTDPDPPEPACSRATARRPTTC